MDSQHRHELKSNELAEGLSHLPQLLKDNARFIIGILLIAAAFITWPMFTKMAQQKEIAEDTATTEAIQMLDQEIYTYLQASSDDAQVQTESLNTLLVNADELLASVSKIDNPNLAAMAQIKAAQAIRTELHLRKEVDAEMLERQIQKAKDAYQNAFETAMKPTIKAMAQFGLGICSEELGQTEQAAEVYQQIVENEDYAPTVMPTLAQHRLDTLDENSETFNFAAAPAPVDNLPAELIQATQAKPQDMAEDTTGQAAEPQTENK